MASEEGSTTTELLNRAMFALNSSTIEPPLRCSPFNGNQHLCDVIVAVKKSMAALSFIGCLFIILVIWLFRKYQVFAQRLILYLAIAACFNSIAYMMGDLRLDGPYCDFQAWAVTFFDWAVLLWVCCITVNLFMNAIRNTRTDRLEWIYHLVSWGVPSVISALPFIGNHYGPSGMWCWIVDNWKWRFGIWYCPLFIVIVALFSTYTYIIVMVHRKVRTWEGLYDPDVERKKEMLKEDVKPLRGYPFVYLAVSIFPLINRIQNAISYEPIFVLVLLHAISSPLQGALNAIVFGMDKETMSRLTPSQIKEALQAHRATEENLIREYPTAPDYQSGGDCQDENAISTEDKGDAAAGVRLTD